MKVTMIIGTVLIGSSVSAAPMLNLNDGESYLVTFGEVDVQNTGAIENAGDARVELDFASFTSGTSLNVEFFEDNSDGTAPAVAEFTFTGSSGSASGVAIITSGDGKSGTGIAEIEPFWSDRQGVFRLTAQGGSVSFDNISLTGGDTLGKEFSFVIPEPATAMLMGLASLALIRRR